MKFLIPKREESKNFGQNVISSISKKSIEDKEFVNHIKFSNKEIVSEKINNIILDFYKSKIVLLSK